MLINIIIMKYNNNSFDYLHAILNFLKNIHIKNVGKTVYNYIVIRNFKTDKICFMEQISIVQTIKLLVYNVIYIL